jgi:hypothetical protein
MVVQVVKGNYKSANRATEVPDVDDDDLSVSDDTYIWLQRGEGGGGSKSVHAHVKFLMEMACYQYDLRLFHDNAAIVGALKGAALTLFF